jgi:hypothetical protein
MMTCWRITILSADCNIVMHFTAQVEKDHWDRLGNAAPVNEADVL